MFARLLLLAVLLVIGCECDGQELPYRSRPVQAEQAPDPLQVIMARLDVIEAKLNKPEQSALIRNVSYTEPSVNWLHSISEGERESKETGKPAWLHFTGTKNETGLSWCGPCNRFAREVLNDSEVQRLQANFVLVELEIPETLDGPNAEFMQGFGESGVPVDYVIDKDWSTFKRLASCFVGTRPDAGIFAQRLRDGLTWAKSQKKTGSASSTGWQSADQSVAQRLTATTCRCGCPNCTCNQAQTYVSNVSSPTYSNGSSGGTYSGGSSGGTVSRISYVSAAPVSYSYPTSYTYPTYASYYPTSSYYSYPQYAQGSPRMVCSGGQCYWSY